MTREHAVATLLSSPIGIAPLDVWIAIKVVLRRELGEREWEMWIQHARLWRVIDDGSPDQTLGVLMPRNGKALFGALRYYKRLRQLGRRMMFGVLLAPVVDLEERELKRQAIVALDGGDPRKEKLLLKFVTEQILLSAPFLEAPCSELWKEVVNAR